MALTQDRWRWYKNRLAAMSGAEILHRVTEAAKKNYDRTRAALALPATQDGDLPEIPFLRAELDTWAVPPDLMQQWREDADRLRQGRYEFLGCVWPACPDDQRWHFDPHSTLLWPRDVFCFDIDYRHGGEAGDIKFAWELNRLQYLQPIAALARKTNDAALARLCAREIESWIDNNPPFLGINWNSGIELVLRAISLMIVATLIGEHFTQTLRGKIHGTLDAHAWWIARYPSRYSSANNHAAAEALALFLIGALNPRASCATLWKETGWRGLCDAARALILPDGVGAEQTTAYTAFALEMFLLAYRVAQAVGVKVPSFYPRLLMAGGEYLRWLQDGAGETPKIGDDDNGCVIGSYHASDRYAASVLTSIAALTGRTDLTPPRLQSHLRQALFGHAPAADFSPYGTNSFAHGGLTIGRHKSTQGDILLAFDHGALGFGSIAAHGHADALALWLHIADQPVFVDAGTYLYHGHAGERARFRSTRLHNTLTLEDCDSSVMSGNFNWSRKAKCTVRSFATHGDFWQCEAEHDGYEAQWQTTHRRALHVSPASGAVIEDRLIGGVACRVAISFLLHPALHARQEGAEIMILRGEQSLLRLRHESPLTASIVTDDVWYAPRFGVKQATTQIVFSGLLSPDQIAITRLYWSV